MTSLVEDLAEIERLTEQYVKEKSVMEKMLKHNSTVKKKKLVESVKNNEKNEWIGISPKTGKKTIKNKTKRGRHWLSYKEK